MEAARLGLKQPFHAAYESTLRNHAAGMPWGDFMHLGHQVLSPTMKVLTKDSRLFHSEIIRSSVATGIEDLAVLEPILILFLGPRSSRGSRGRVRTVIFFRGCWFLGRFRSGSWG